VPPTADSTSLGHFPLLWAPDMRLRGGIAALLLASRDAENHLSDAPPTLPHAHAVTPSAVAAPPAAIGAGAVAGAAREEAALRRSGALEYVGGREQHAWRREKCVH
jgi:hypothetical protein